MARNNCRVFKTFTVCCIPFLFKSQHSFPLRILVQVFRQAESAGNVLGTNRKNHKKGTSKRGNSILSCPDLDDAGAGVEQRELHGPAAAGASRVPAEPVGVAAVRAGRPHGRTAPSRTCQMTNFQIRVKFNVGPLQRSISTFDFQIPIFDVHKSHLTNPFHDW